MILYFYDAWFRRFEKITIFPKTKNNDLEKPESGINTWFYNLLSFIDQSSLPWLAISVLGKTR